MIILLILTLVGTLFIDSSHFVYIYSTPKWLVLVYGLVIFKSLSSSYIIYLSDKIPVHFYSILTFTIVLVVFVEVLYGIVQFIPVISFPIIGTFDNTAGLVTLGLYSVYLVLLLDKEKRIIKSKYLAQRIRHKLVKVSSYKVQQTKMSNMTIKLC